MAKQSAETGAPPMNFKLYSAEDIKKQYASEMYIKQIIHIFRGDIEKETQKQPKTDKKKSKKSSKKKVKRSDDDDDEL